MAITFMVPDRVPDTSYHRHFIFQVTSYQREKLSLHTSHFIPSHFIQSDTSYQSLHTKPFHTEVTSYQSLHIEVTSYQPLHTSHFIPKSLHTSHFIPSSLHTEVTSYQATSYQSLHTRVTSYQLYHTSALHIRALHTDIGKVNKI